MTFIWGLKSNDIYFINAKCILIPLTLFNAINLIVRALIEFIIVDFFFLSLEIWRIGVANFIFLIFSK